MKKLILLISATLAGATLAMGQVIALEQWTFDDAAGKTLKTSTNSGTNASIWNFGGEAIVTDGTGNLVLPNTHTGGMFRKLPDAGTANAAAGSDSYLNPYNTGTYRLEMSLTGWNFSDTHIGDMTFGALDAASSGTMIAGIRVKRQDPTTARVQMFTDLDGTAQGFRNFDFPLSDTTSRVYAVEFDFDNNTVKYFQNGSETHSFTDFAGIQLATLQFNTSNTWIAGAEVSIGDMTLYAVPEAATYSLYLGLLSLGLVLWRRRRSV